MTWSEGMAEAYSLGMEAGKRDAEKAILDQDAALTECQRQGHAELRFLGCFAQGYQHGWCETEPAA